MRHRRAELAQRDLTPRPAHPHAVPPRSCQVAHRSGLSPIFPPNFSTHPSITADDIPFVSRVVLQSLLHGCPADLAAEGSQLSACIQPLINVSAQTLGLNDMLGKLDELCPACGIAVPLQDITTAVCANGHTWRKISPILSAAQVTDANQS